MAERAYILINLFTHKNVRFYGIITSKESVLILLIIGGRFYSSPMLNVDMSYFGDTQYDTELVEVSSSFSHASPEAMPAVRGNPALQRGKDVIRTIEKIPPVRLRLSKIKAPFSYNVF